MPNAELHKVYKRVFSTEDGAEILADLKLRFGWAGDVERPSYQFGASHADTAMLEGMKAPVRHILTQIAKKPDTEKHKEASDGLSA